MMPLATPSRIKRNRREERGRSRDI